MLRLACIKQRLRKFCYPSFFRICASMLVTWPAPLFPRHIARHIAGVQSSVGVKSRRSRPPCHEWRGVKVTDWRIAASAQSASLPILHSAALSTGVNINQSKLNMFRGQLPSRQWLAIAPGEST
jgi:hypothetical protein